MGYMPACENQCHLMTDRGIINNFTPVLKSCLSTTLTNRKIKNMVVSKLSPCFNIGDKGLGRSIPVDVMSKLTFLCVLFKRLSKNHQPQSISDGQTNTPKYICMQNNPHTPRLDTQPIITLITSRLPSKCTKMATYSSSVDAGN